MAFAGMFALGIFVGGVVTLGLKQAPGSVDNFIKIMGAVLTATFSGTIVAFMDKYKVSTDDPKNFQSFFMYPIGLLVALLWLYFEDVWHQTNPLLSWGGAISIVLISILAAAIALSPRFRKLLD
jgi:hypothetical protein